MPLTILTDTEVRTLLHSLHKDDILDLQQSLADALHYYSTSTEEDANGCCSSYQPLRTQLKRSDGQTTLFMPASSNDGLGVKVVTLPSPESSKSTDSSSLGSLESLSLKTPSSNASSTTAFDGPPDSIASSQSTAPRGTLTLLDRFGTPRAFINAEELTAFRTALASTMLFKKRTSVHDLTIFGAGKQAYWHVRLALLLRGPEIHHLNIINRSFDSAQKLVQRLFNPDIDPSSTTPLPELCRPKVQILSANHNEYDRLLKSTVRSSAVIFCTTPSLSPLFPASYLTNPEGRKKGRYIAAIGSYKPHMQELHPDILRQNVAPPHSHHHHKHAPQGGAIIVDSVEACMQEAGEIIQAGLNGREVVEIGELLMLKRDAQRRRAEALAAKDADGAEELDSSGVELGSAKKVKGKQKDVDIGDKGLAEWLQRGNVIFKCVGLGLMDVVAGADLVRLADERGIGTKIENF